MSQLKNKILLLVAIAIFSMSASQLHGQLLGSGYQTVIKTEYQYSDYFDYTYPDPVLYEYPDQLYFQPAPYIASFPEHRFLTRVTQYFGFNTSLGLRYQWSHLDRDNRQRFYNLRLDHELNDQFSVMASYQFMSLDNRKDAALDYSGHTFEIGGKFNFAGAVNIEPSIGYYTSGYFSPAAISGGGYTATLNLRQALGRTTALQAKYYFMKVDLGTKSGGSEKFDANTLTLWLSQYLPTETAVHLSNRFYWNTQRTQSFSPGLEVVQYLNWKTIVHLSYRYYKNRPGVDALLQRIEGNSFATHAISAILEYSFSANTKVQLKYRYYTSDQKIQMNTYLVAMEHIL
ncbi:MAG: DUF3570 domain-containing protein [candidate division KSB1 bacterium]|nr:DUF3570 domain-containing protein [candidate division KSB1 bacterium]MDZ7317889.1 DUF3570 domain-containing protein [candidate division KSB1 bacterium]MDZ7341739.1 DUF3570 domain-containing protein [candidate division KSB1 bacterium]